jgi:DNA-directed RNA polymerase subunit N (RpoN/RPB10)
MYPYIVCFCGRSLGDIYDLFKAMRDDRIKEVFGDVDFDPVAAALNELLKCDISDVFESLHLHNDCCRTRIMTQVEFKDLY